MAGSVTSQSSTATQFLDFMLALHVYRETGRRVRFLVAAKSMHGTVGFFATLSRSSASFLTVLDLYIR